MKTEGLKGKFSSDNFMADIVTWYKYPLVYLLFIQKTH